MSHSAILPNHSSHAASLSRKRRRRWVVAGAGGLLAAGGLSLLLASPELQPWDDLKPWIIPPLSEGKENGREILKAKWLALPDQKGPATPGKLEKLVDGVIPWDRTDPELAAAAARGGDRLEELRLAMEAGGWRSPDYARVSDQFRDQLHLHTALAELGAMIHGHIDARRMEAAAEAILLLAEASQREIQAAPLPGRLEQGLQLSQAMLCAIPPFLEAAGGREELLCERLQKACAEESINAARLKDCIFRDVESRCRDLLNLPRAARIPGKEGPRTRGYSIGSGIMAYFLNSRAAVNLFHRELRAAVPRLLAPALRKEDTLAGLVAGFPSGAGGGRGLGNWLPLNSEGRRYVLDEMKGWNELDVRCRHHLFQQRAMRVRIALHRMEVAEARQPEQLEELVPWFLEEVPADPFDGQPMRWSRSGGGVIYALGVDWTDDGPGGPAAPPAEEAEAGKEGAVRESGGYFSQDPAHPAVRHRIWEKSGTGD